MKKFLEKYFPVMRSHPDRIHRWERRKLLTVSRYSGNDLKVMKCVFRAPVPAAAGRKILFISDWHWYASKRNRQLLDAVESVAREAAPDLLVLGGDLCEDADTIHTLPELLTQLRKLAPECIAVHGNWEVGKRWLKADFWKEMYAACDIKLLVNECYTSGAIRFHGIDDITSGDCRLPEQLDSSIPRSGSLPMAEVLVAHSPDTVIALDEKNALHGFDLALCGHCHGGQIRLPFIGALFCPSRYGKYFSRGAFARIHTRMKMIVSAGIGERSGSFRFNCAPEILLVSFRKARHYRMRGQAKEVSIS